MLETEQVTMVLRRVVPVVMVIRTLLLSDHRVA